MLSGSLRYDQWLYDVSGEKEDSGIEDASIVATHMILFAADQGLNSRWINFLDPYKLHKALGLLRTKRYSWLWTLGTLQRKELRYRITLHQGA